MMQSAHTHSRPVAAPWPLTLTPAPTVPRGPRWALSALCSAVLLAACGGSGGGGSGGSGGNSAPIANAGPAQTVAALSTVTLDGSGSADPDGDALVYGWAIATRPANSAAILSDDAARLIRPTFVPDAPGTYVLTLGVSDARGAASAPATVTITVVGGNEAPIANAGQSRSAIVGQTLNLDGVQSTDRNRDPLSYTWTITTRPAGSTAALTDGNTALASFKPDVAGTYVASLVVNDGTVNSAPHSVTITARAGLTLGQNAEPITDVGRQPPGGGGRERQVLVGSTVVVNGGSSSDPDGSPLIYNWATPLTRPTGSSATFSTTASNAQSNTFVADVAGTYRPQLVVNDGTSNSPPAQANFLAVAANVNAVPWAVAGNYLTAVAGTETVTLNGGASSDANPSDSTLDYYWMLVSRPSTSTAILSGTRTAQPTFTPDVPGVYIASLVVSDRRATSLPDAVAIVAVPAAGPYNGTWTGTTGQSPAQSFQFTVEANRITSLVFNWVSVSCRDAAGAIYASNTAASPNPPIVAGGGSFRLTQPAGIVQQFSGSFSGTTNASGSLIFALVFPDGCREQVITNFTATKR